jgi:hypothetical protein
VSCQTVFYRCGRLLVSCVAIISSFCGTYAGFVIKCFQQEECKKTVLTYLPPIEKPITDYGALFEVIARASHLSKEANMKYVHIIMDCGAAMKMYHVIWNNPDTFSKVIVHLMQYFNAL